MDFTSRIKSANQIAIIRSSYPRHLEDALIAIKQINPLIQITVLALPAMRAALKQNTKIDEVVTLPENSAVYPEKTGRDFTEELRTRQFPLMLILYNRSNQGGYSNVESLIRSFSPASIYGMTTDGAFFELNTFYLLMRFCKRFILSAGVSPLILPMILFLKFLAYYTRFEEK